MTQAAAITYTKLRSGEWGIRGPASILRDGAEVTVAKKSGERKVERVAKVVWQGDGIALAAIAQRAGDRDGRGRSYDPDKFNGYGAARGGYRRACKTDGNCSSIGSGRSCGGHDCDGY